MSDKQGEVLRRVSATTGAPHDRAAVLSQRLRNGSLTQWRLWTAAYLGDETARIVAEPGPVCAAAWQALAEPSWGSIDTLLLKWWVQGLGKLTSVPTNRKVPCPNRLSFGKVSVCGVFCDCSAPGTGCGTTPATQPCGGCADCRYVGGRKGKSGCNGTGKVPETESKWILLAAACVSARLVLPEWEATHDDGGYGLWCRPGEETSTTCFNLAGYTAIDREPYCSGCGEDLSEHGASLPQLTLEAAELHYREKTAETNRAWRLAWEAVDPHEFNQPDWLPGSLSDFQLTINTAGRITTVRPAIASTLIPLVLK